VALVGPGVAQPAKAEALAEIDGKAVTGREVEKALGAPLPEAAGADLQHEAPEAPRHDRGTSAGRRGREAMDVRRADSSTPR